MTKRCLIPERRTVVRIHELIAFGRIVRLVIYNGQPYFKQPPRIVHDIKLAAARDDQRPGPDDLDYPLMKEFVSLFAELEQIGNGIVDIEIRHHLPFRVVVERSVEEFLA